MTTTAAQIGSIATNAELVAHGVNVPEGVIPVWGSDWEGNPVLRGARTGIKTVLVGEFGQGFNVDGPVVSVCSECSDLILSPTSGHHTMNSQRHYATHGISAGLLP